MNNLPVGHFVISPTGLPMEIREYDGTKVLVCGNNISIFDTSKECWDAVKRTIEYAKNNPLFVCPWKQSQFKVHIALRAPK